LVPALFYRMWVVGFIHEKGVPRLMAWKSAQLYPKPLFYGTFVGSSRLHNRVARKLFFLVIHNLLK